MNFIKQDDCIKFTDTSGITSKMWTKMFYKLNHLNYGFHDEDDVKTYFDRHNFLNKEQTAEVLKVLNGEHDQDMYPISRIQRDNLLAKEYFGTTDNFKSAGYILTDGSMLYFSYQRTLNREYRRNRDHREIEQAIEIDSDGYSDAMIQFMNYGNIRVTSCGLDIAKRPTSAQYNRISNLARQLRRNNDSLYIDISNNEGYCVKNFYYEIPFSKQVIDDISNYFDMITI